MLRSLTQYLTYDWYSILKTQEFTAQSLCIIKCRQSRIFKFKVSASMENMEGFKLTLFQMILRFRIKTHVIRNLKVSLNLKKMTQISWRLISKSFQKKNSSKLKSTSLLLKMLFFLKLSHFIVFDSQMSLSVLFVPKSHLKGKIIVPKYFWLFTPQVLLWNNILILTLHYSL